VVGAVVRQLPSCHQGAERARQDNQPALGPEAPRVLGPLAARHAPAARVLERAQGRWGRRRRWRSQAWAGG
jgi:hypothetical protein